MEGSSFAAVIRTREIPGFYKEGWSVQAHKELIAKRDIQKVRQGFKDAKRKGVVIVVPKCEQFAKGVGSRLGLNDMPLERLGAAINALKHAGELTEKSVDVRELSASRDKEHEPAVVIGLTS